MHKYIKILIASFGIARGVLSREERKKWNQAKFNEFYLGDLNLGSLMG